MPAAKALRRHLPQSRNTLMHIHADPHVLASKCRIQDVKFDVRDGEGVIKTFVRIKTALPNSSLPQFIMRQAQDDYVSATSMFRAIFPDASMEEEEHEMAIVKRDLNARSDEHASGVWIPGTPDALQLAKVYGIEAWVEALLQVDTTAPSHTSPTRRLSAGKSVPSASSSFSAEMSTQALAPALAPPATPRPIAPAKSKVAKSPKKASVPTTDKKQASSSTLASLSESLVDAVDGALARTREALQPESLPPSSTKNNNNNNNTGNGKVKVVPSSNNKNMKKKATATPDSKTQGNGSAGGLLAQLKQDASEVLTATGARHAPQSVAEMLAEAKQQVAESRRLDAQALSHLSPASTNQSRSKKRSLEVEDGTPTGPEQPHLHGKMEDVALHGKMEAVPRNKRTKVEELEVQVAAERRKVRALVGLVLGLGATAVLPYVL
ncbi:hypothetical protein BCR37DRAFT_377384 [Protomyces lactucae-debilis]|uniref:HTH APSES-type domain-containing protein n=1 Tax=Protomyces lactucae-debilis TaxID=2754530 RepID=A0A1Y2FQT4_PROLT|nr:uncharacterized protein BCR37DRAFT_377384 [Protomyces lactucae-debilis]ORY85684.1 hypothetical protein BCR37DRAFT_377384 [Protomyces lactucae-debilis]